MSVAASSAVIGVNFPSPQPTGLSLYRERVGVAQPRDLRAPRGPIVDGHVPGGAIHQDAVPRRAVDLFFASSLLFALSLLLLASSLRRFD